MSKFFTTSEDGEELVMLLTTEAKEVLDKIGSKTGLPKPNPQQDQTTGLWHCPIDPIGAIDMLMQMVKHNWTSPSEAIVAMWKEAAPDGEFEGAPYPIADFVKHEPNRGLFVLLEPEQAKYITRRIPREELPPELRNPTTPVWVPAPASAVTKIYACARAPDKSFSDTMKRVMTPAS